MGIGSYRQHDFVLAAGSGYWQQSPGERQFHLCHQCGDQCDGAAETNLGKGLASIANSTALNRVQFATDARQSRTS